MRIGSWREKAKAPSKPVSGFDHCRGDPQRVFSRAWILLCGQVFTLKALNSQISTLTPSNMGCFGLTINPFHHEICGFRTRGPFAILLGNPSALRPMKAREEVRGDEAGKPMVGPRRTLDSKGERDVGKERGDCVAKREATNAACGCCSDGYACLGAYGMRSWRIEERFRWRRGR